MKKEKLNKSRRICSQVTVNTVGQFDLRYTATIEKLRFDFKFYYAPDGPYELCRRIGGNGSMVSTCSSVCVCIRAYERACREAFSDRLPSNFF